MDKIIMMLENFIEGIEILPFNNGGIEVRLQDSDDVAAVLATVADAMHDWDVEDVQITTDQAGYKVYIDEVDRED